MDISFIYYRIKEHIKRGDIVVLPLEFEFYKRDQQSAWFTSNMMAWGEEHYLKKLSFYEYLSFLLRVEESRVIDGLFQRKREVPNLSKNEVIKQLSSLLESEGPKWRKYSFKSLDKYGNINVNKKPEEKIVRRYKAGISFLKKEVIISGPFLLYHSRMSDLVAQYQGKLVLAWPVTLRNKKFDLSKPEHQKKVDAFRKKLKTRGINIRFNPALFNLGLNFFFNSEYHANKNGAAIRSENLAHCLNSLIEQGNSNDISYDEAIQTVRAQESIYNLKYDLNNTRP
jgi:hypothetical protein